MILDVLAGLLLLGGCAFFAAGTLGILRFPDLHSRLHALTKADNVGLGLVVLALMLQSGSAAVVAKLLLIWVLALLAAATSSHLLARGVAPQLTGPARRGGGGPA